MSFPSGSVLSAFGSLFPCAPVGPPGSFSLCQPEPGLHPALALAPTLSRTSWSQQLPVPPSHSDPLLAGLSRDPDYPVSCPCSASLPSNVCLATSKKCDKSWGSSPDQALDCRTIWARTAEPESLAPAEDMVTCGDCRPGWGSGVRLRGVASFPKADSPKDRCHEQELLKRHHVVAKKPLETNCFKSKAKSTTMIPDSQKILRFELESLKNQLQAQAKAFEFLNHSVTMLEKESCLQQIKIQQLEEMLSPMSCQAQKELHKWGLEQGRQELYGALAQGLQGLQKTLRDSEEVQQARTARCLQLLAQEVRDSKKFLWEELELVREEVTFIYQKLKVQEEEITENLMNIQKMRKTQMKCRKVLTKIKQQGCEMPPWPDTEGMPAGGGSSWRNDLQKELSDIWSAVHVLQNSIDTLAVAPEGRPRATSLGGDGSQVSLGGHKGHRCVSPAPPSWDSDSDSDTSQPTFTKSLSFPPA